MVTRKVILTPEKAHPGLLPPWATQYVVATQWLAERGILEQVEQRLQVVRQGLAAGSETLACTDSTSSVTWTGTSKCASC